MVLHIPGIILMVEESGKFWVLGILSYEHRATWYCVCLFAQLYIPLLIFFCYIISCVSLVRPLYQLYYIEGEKQFKSFCSDKGVCIIDYA